MTFYKMTGYGGFLFFLLFFYLIQLNSKYEDTAMATFPCKFETL